MSKVESSEETIRLPPVEEDTGNGLIYSTLSSSVNFLRPFAPQIVPLVVCIFFIPIILAISAFSGYVVWNSVSARWQASMYLQYGDSIAPYAQSVVSSLHASQRYDISLRLIIPTSESNLALGNFMATLKLSTANNKTLAFGDFDVSGKAVAVVPRAWWLLGSSHVIAVDIPMLTSFVPGASSLLAEISIGRHDNWRILGNGEARELSVVSASLHGLAVPHGIRGLAIRFPLLLSFGAAFIFLCISSLILGMCILPIMLPTGLEDDGTPIKPESSFVPFPPSDRPRWRNKSHFRRTSEQASPSSSVVKEEGSSANAEEAIPERPRQRKKSVKREPDVEL